MCLQVSDWAGLTGALVTDGTRTWFDVAVDEIFRVNVLDAGDLGRFGG